MKNQKSCIEGKRILAVDDDADILEIIEEILTGAWIKPGTMRRALEKPGITVTILSFRTL